jgi:DNA-binding transcriptional ArsR family regulator
MRDAADDRILERSAASPSVEIFKALGEPTRLALFELLALRPHHVTDLVRALAVPQPAVSRHLRILKEAGLVSDHRSGRRVEYRLRRDNPGIPSLLEACRAHDRASRTVAPAANVPRPPEPERSKAIAAQPPERSTREGADAEFVVHSPPEPFDSYLL